MDLAGALSSLGFTIVVVLLGAAIASAIIRLFFWMGGGKVASFRQAAVAYLVYTIAGIFIGACGAADGGPPNFSGTFSTVLASAIALLVEFFYFRRNPTGHVASQTPPPLAGAKVQKPIDPIRRGFKRILLLGFIPTAGFAVIILALAISKQYQPLLVWTGAHLATVPSHLTSEAAVEYIVRTHYPGSQALQMAASDGLGTKVWDAQTRRANEVSQQISWAFVSGGFAVIWAAFWGSVSWIVNGFRKS